MLRKFHQSNGGEDAWNKQSAVRFRYEVELGGHTGKVVLPEIVLRLGDYRHVWVRREGDPQPVRLVLGESPAIEDSLALGFALSSLPYFFCLPLASAADSWEFRSLVGPPGIPVPAEFETVPPYAQAPMGACLIQAGRSDDPLVKIVYKGRHPFLAARPHSLEFQDYRKVSGVEIAHVRTHSVLEPEVFDPFEDATEPPTWILRETLRHVVFLSREEADQRYPVVDPGHEAR
jgi:hypothetical protein